RLLEKIERPRWHLLAEARGLRDIQAMVVVDSEHDAVTQRLACRHDAPRRRTDRFTRLVDVVVAAVPGGKEAEHAPALRHQLPGLLDHRRPELGRSRSEGRNPVALLAAEEFVDR